MSRKKHSLIHRGYLYAQKHVLPASIFAMDASALRMTVAEVWKQGYLQAQRDAKKTS